MSDETQTTTPVVFAPRKPLTQVKRFIAETFVGSVCQDFYMLCLYYSIVCPCRVRVQAATFDYFKEVISNMSLVPVVV